MTSTMNIRIMGLSFLSLALLMLLSNSCKKTDSSDHKPPVITLIGDTACYIDLAALWEDPGVHANDDVDGDLTSSVIISGTVNTSLVDQYRIKYSVSDSSGNVDSAFRHVYVGAYPLTGIYAVHDSIIGANAGLMNYSINVDSAGSGRDFFNTLKINNFRGFGQNVDVVILFKADQLIIPLQALIGVPASYSGQVSGNGTYSATDPRIMTIHYTINYSNSFTDKGYCLLLRQ